MQMSLVIPVHNEQETVDSFVDRTNEVFNNHDAISIEFVFVNDGSTDATLEKLLKRQLLDSRIRIIDLSRNFGKEAALSAGLQLAKGDVVVPIDADLQDPPELILEMISKWREGFEVVLGHRINRDSDTWLKRFSAGFFYRVHNKISEMQLPENVGDFRLMDRKVVDALKQMPETRRFMKGLFSWIGFRTAYVDYVRPKRMAGSTSFNGWSLWNLALEGVTSFSTVPLRVWTYLGFSVAFISFVFAIFIVIKVLAYGIDSPGYASLMVVITFMGGLQLIGLGVLGEYVGRIYIESKRRPVFLIRQIFESKL